MIEKIKKGFTLAETLTVLMIIGVVAVITIPSLYSNVEEQKKMTILKKLYSSFSVNIQSVLTGMDETSDDGTVEANVAHSTSCSSLSCLRAWGNTDEDKTPINTEGKTIRAGEHNGILADGRYFNIAAVCNNCFTTGSVMPAPMEAAEEEKKDADGKVTQKKTSANYTAYLLPNAASIAIYDFSENCTTTAYVKNNDEDVALCGIVVFDVNAEKGANVPGNDRFAYYIADEPVNGSFLVPIGYKTDDNIRLNNLAENADKYVISTVGTGKCEKTMDINGYNCTAKIMLDGWKVKY